MIKIRVKNQQQVKARLEKAEKTFPQKFADALRVPLRTNANEGRRIARQKFGSRSSQAKAFGFSLKKVRGKALAFVARLGFIRTQRAYLANFYERGATIRPKKRQYVYVPILGNRSRDGSAILSARDAITQGNTFLHKSRAGNLIMFQRPTAGTAEFGDFITPLFALKKQVRIPARPVFSLVNEKAQKEIQQAAEDAVRKALE